MRRTILRAEGISKQYRLGQLGTGTISHDLNRFWARVRGKEDPYLKLGEANDRSKVGNSDYVWSLREIDFEVKEGDVLGIIGKNGAGKSTLLKILSQVTTPSTGQVKVKGRIASLLEVGTGFHPDLSGKENIFLNGAILGMTKSEIKLKLDEIIDFSGVARYIDTPVKRYSSGMMVRLGFAVAAHLEPEILIVDEVLAVGDSEFQKKCLGKMKEVSGQGRTVLFVSHNLEAVSNLCSTGLLLENGQIKKSGAIEDCIKSYLVSARNINMKELALDNRLQRAEGNILFSEIRPMRNGEETWEFDYNDNIIFKIKASVKKYTENVLFYLALRHPFSGETISNFDHLVSEDKLMEGNTLSFTVTIPSRIVRPGQYGLYFWLGDKEARFSYDVIDSNVNLPMLNINPVSMNAHENTGFISMPFQIKHDL